MSTSVEPAEVNVSLHSVTKPVEVNVSLRSITQVQVISQPVTVPIVASAALGAQVRVVSEPVVVPIIAAAALGPRGPAGATGPFFEGHTYAVLGDLTGVIVLPSFFVPKAATQTVKLAGMFADLDSGNINFQLKRNGVNVGSAVALGQMATWTSFDDVLLNNGDKISALLSGHTNVPTTLSATIVLEWSIP